MADLPPVEADLAPIVERAWARCETAVHAAIAEAGGDEDLATLISLGLASRLAGFCTREIMGHGGRTDLADLAQIHADEVRWALEAIANLDLEALADATSATLVLGRGRS